MDESKKYSITLTRESDHELGHQFDLRVGSPVFDSQVDSRVGS